MDAVQVNQIYAEIVTGLMADQVEEMQARCARSQTEAMQQLFRNLEEG
jgi:hypothetical protein